MYTLALGVGWVGRGRGGERLQKVRGRGRGREQDNTAGAGAGADNTEVVRIGDWVDAALQSSSHKVRQI